MQKAKSFQEEDGCFQQEEIHEEVRQRMKIELEQANPIYTKHISEEPAITLKFIESQKPDFVSNYTPFRFRNSDQKNTVNPEEMKNYKHLLSFESPFTKYYDIEQLVYQKCDNDLFNRFKDVRYYSGFFLSKNLLYETTQQTTTSLRQIIKESQDKIQRNKAMKKITNILPQHHDQSLLFDSDFQSGNLFAVFRTGKYSYELVMQNDTNSKGSNQWFYFSVEKMLQNTEYTFTIVNFTKRDSLFNYGLKPAFYSVVGNKKFGEGWHRYGKNVSYFKGEINRENSMRYYYSLHFTISTRHPQDKIYLAHSYPYTYTKLNTFISEITKPTPQDKYTTPFITKMSIGTSISGKPIHCIKICEIPKKKNSNRKAIIILARQHPGETQGSYVCEGVIKKLVERGNPKKQREGQFLRKNYIFYVIPMVNIDGVVFGNYRTNLAGKDLNRKWDTNDKQQICPQVSVIKQFISEISKQNEIRFILDLHGHSRKFGSFFYGNPCQQNPEYVRIYPYICSRINQGVQYMDCTFHVDQCKKKAARVYLSFLYKQIHVYTFESSFYGFMKNQKVIEFTPKEYCTLGETLIQALYIQLEHQIKTENEGKQLGTNKSKEKEAAENMNIGNPLFLKFSKQLYNDDILLEVGKEDESGSDSNPDEGEINIDEVTIAKPSEEKKKPNKVQIKKEEPKTCEKTSKSSAIRITSKKHNTVEYKDFTKPTRNLKFLALSQVNAVLPDKYHISLQPLERREKARGNVVDAQCQTQPYEKHPLKKFKLSEIMEKDNLCGELQTGRKTSHSKRQSQLMNSLQKNQVFRADLTIDDPLIRRRHRSLRRDHLKSSFTQTILSYRVSKNMNNPKKIEKNVSKITTQNEARIARMDQINFEVLKVYSRRSAIVDIGIKNNDKDRSYQRIGNYSTSKKNVPNI